ncbi:MAG: ferredoxin [Candidatus Natronoplasma sp.]
MRSVKIDQDTCIGCGACESTCPEVFELNAKAKSTVLEEYRTGKENEGEVPDDIGCVEDAENGCPVDAISVS